MKKWLKRIGLGFLGLVVLALAAGATFEQWKRYRAPKDFPPSGKMVDVGGRRIQIDCRGVGSPTVVLESGGDPFGATDWIKVQDAVARTTRTCSYSRAGIMWSDPAPGARDGNAIVADLHALLENAGEHAPFVLVGWSLGGPYSVLYTQRHGADVAGLVLVDSSHPDQLHQIEAITHRPPQLTPPATNIAVRLTWTGLLRLLLLPDATKAQAAFLPTSLTGAHKEIASIEETFAEIANKHDLGNRPVVVLTGMAPYSAATLQGIGISPEEGRTLKKAWKRMHDDMASWSSNGKNVIVTDSDHNIPTENPQVVIRAIDAVVSAARSGAPLR